MQALIALGARSENNSYGRQVPVLGLYSYTLGAHRQTLSVWSHLGITCSYPTLAGKWRTLSDDELAEDGEGAPLQPEAGSTAIVPTPPPPPATPSITEDPEQIGPVDSDDEDAEKDIGVCDEDHDVPQETAQVTND